MSMLSQELQSFDVLSSNVPLDWWNTGTVVGCVMILLGWQYGVTSVRVFIMAHVQGATRTAQPMLDGAQCTVTKDRRPHNHE
jgi:hypothetical protein